MACEYVDDDPHASEYARKGSPSDSDNDEGLYVEPNATVTKLLTTRGSRNSNEPTNVDTTDHINTMDALEHMPLHTLRVRQEEGLLTKEECDRLESLRWMNLL